MKLTNEEQVRLKQAEDVKETMKTPGWSIVVNNLFSTLAEAKLQMNENNFKEILGAEKILKSWFDKCLGEVHFIDYLNDQIIQESKTEGELYIIKEHK